MKLEEVKSALENLDTIAFQLPNGDLVPNHRLHPEKLVHIIELSQKTLDIGNLEVEVEYQGQTIEKFALEFDGKNFLLTSKETDCLARDKCGVPAEKPKVKISELQNSGCVPGSGCC